jgi:hypothetical protein
MRYEDGTILYCCRNVQGQAIKGEVTVTVVGYNARMDAYAVEFEGGGVGILRSKLLRTESMWEAAEKRERREYARLKKKYGDA